MNTNKIRCKKCDKNWTFQKIETMIDFAKGHHRYTGHPIEIIRKPKDKHYDRKTVSKLNSKVGETIWVGKLSHVRQQAQPTGIPRPCTCEKQSDF